MTLRRSLPAAAVLLCLAAMSPSTALAAVPNDDCQGAVRIQPTSFPFTTTPIDVFPKDGGPQADTTNTGDPAWTCDLAPATRPPLSGGYWDPRIWYSFTPAQTGIYRVTTCPTVGDSPDTVLEIFDGVFGCAEVGDAGTRLNACSNNTGFIAELNCQASRSATQTLMEAGRTYFIVAGHKANGFGTNRENNASIQLTIDLLPGSVPNDRCQGAVAIPDVTTSAVKMPSVDLDQATLTADPIPSVAVCGMSLVSGVPTFGAAAGDNSRGVWYTFTPSVTQTYRLDTCGTPSIPGAIHEAAIALYTSTGGCNGPFIDVPGACDSSSCGLYGGTQATLTAGTTYYVLVYQGNQLIRPAGLSNVQLRVLPPPSNDVCTGAITLPANVPVLGHNLAASNDTSLDGGWDPYDGGIGHTVVAGLGRDVVYKFAAPADGQYSFRVTPTSPSSTNALLYVADDASCNPGSTLPANVLKAANRHNSAVTPAPGEEVMCMPMTAGQNVYVYVDDGTPVGQNNSAGGTFELEATSCLLETEPNYDLANANPFACGIQGSITPGDYDSFSLGAPLPGAKVFAFVDAYSAGFTNDFDLRVTDDTHVLEYDDNANDVRGGASSANICGTTLQGADTFLRVNYRAVATPREPYRLYAVVQPPVAPLVELEPNNTRATAMGGELNFFSGAVPANPDGGRADDTDYYEFVGVAGDVIHIGLDGDPTRDGGTGDFDGELTLYDQSGTLLISANNTGEAVSVVTDATLDAGRPNYRGEAMTYRLTASGWYYVRVAGGTTGAKGGGIYQLSIARNCQPGTGIKAPTAVTQVTPNTGSTLGNLGVDVFGAGFTPASRVRIGGTFSPMTLFIDSGHVQAVTPSGAEGPASVEVVNAGGQIAALPSGFTYVAAPDFVAINVSSGPTVGGTPFTITGTGFGAGNLQVFFGTSLATVSSVSPTQISGTTPAHAAGAVNIKVSHDYGEDTQSSAFTFIAAPFIGGVTPATGSTLGGGTLTINGQNFDSSATVKIGGVTATSVGPNSATQLVVGIPPHAAGAVSVQVINLDLQQDTVSGAFTYLAPPSISTISPTSGTSNGGELITLTGSGFASGATVLFGTVAGTGVNVAPTGDSLTVSAPGHTMGQVDVTVRNPDSQQATKVNGYLYVSPFPAPTITGLTPSSGTTAGGTSVVLAGTGLRAGATVTLDGVSVGAVVDVTNQTITFTTPAHAYGQVSVVVTNDDAQTASANFTYVAPAPTIASVALDHGRVSGGELITISGTGFLAGATVDLGGTACTGVNVANDTTLQCTTGVHAAGFVTVTVRNPDAQTAVRTNGFEYVAPPVLTALAPSSGSTLGGNTVVFTGTSFRAPVTVEFDSAAATSVTFDSGTQLTVVTPARSAGVVSVTVRNGDGQFFTLPGAFTFFAPPTLTAVSPTSGVASAGTNVTLTGTAFRAGATVSFVVGGVSVPATNVVVVSSTSITARTPAHAPGLGDVVVTNVDGQSATLTGGFTFVGPPTLSAVAPNHGSASGLTSITLTGSGFQAGATVSLGGVNAIGVARLDAQTLTATTGAHAPGTVDVLVTNPDGQSVTLTGGFTYDAPPSVSLVTPNEGVTTGGNSATISGTGFATGATVKFGTTTATVTNVTATAITVTVPARSVGTVGVTVTNPDGQSSTLANAYRYLTPVSLTSLSPSTGPVTGGTLVTLTGANITPSSTVTFGGVASTQVTVLNATTVEAVAPAHAVGAVDVVLTTPASGSATLQGAFTFEAIPPNLTGVSPNRGATEGGTLVELTGSGFSPDAQVTFGGQPATSVSMINPSLIQARTPSHAAGPVAVVVTNPDGLSTSKPAAFEYVVVADAGTGNTDGGVTEEPTPPSGCGCGSADLSALGLMSLASLAFFRRRRS